MAAGPTTRVRVLIIILALGGASAVLPSAFRLVAAANAGGGSPARSILAAAFCALGLSIPVAAFILGLHLLCLHFLAEAKVPTLLVVLAVADVPTPLASAPVVDGLAAVTLTVAMATMLLGAALFSLGF